MRVELPPALVAVGRGSGLAGVLAAVAGGAALAAAFLPWHEAAAELTMLGAAEQRTVVALPGFAAPLGLAASLAGLLAATLGIALAVDRHPGWTRRGLIGAAAVLAASGLAAQVQRPGLDRFPDDAGALADLRAVVDDLPHGVELTLSVRPGPAAAVALVAGLAVAVAVVAARDLDAS